MNRVLRQLGWPNIVLMVFAIIVFALTATLATKAHAGYSSSYSSGRSSYSSSFSSYRSTPSYSAPSYSRPTYAAPSAYRPAPSYTVRSTTVSSSYKPSPAATARTSTFTQSARPQSSYSHTTIKRTTVIHQPVYTQHYGYGGYYGSSGMDSFWHGYFLASMFNHQSYGQPGYAMGASAGYGPAYPPAYNGWGIALEIILAVLVISLLGWLVVSLYRRLVD